jgi:hypothetical protein
VFGSTQWILVGHQHRCADFIAKLKNAVVWIAAYGEADFSPRQFLLNVRKALHEKCAVSQIRIRDRHQTEEHQYRFAESVPNLYGSF